MAHSLGPKKAAAGTNTPTCSIVRFYLPVDQPVGTGFSYVTNNAFASSLSQAAKEVAFFLERFVEVFPEYARSVHDVHGTSTGYHTYIAGES